MSKVFGSSVTTPGGEKTPTKEDSKGDEAPKKDEDAAPEVGQMRRGDYLIHVFLEQARQLKCPEGNTVDPLIEVSVFNEKKYTSVKDDIGGGTALCTWNEHLFFEPRNVDVEALEAGKIQVRVLDKGFFKEAVIGVYEFDLAYVYFMAKHCLLHRWIALSNPASENFNEITGYLKLSIQVTTKGDETIQINQDTAKPGSDEGVMMPPQIKPEYYQIFIRFFRAEKLPMMDNNLLGQATSIDAYITCQYLNHKLSTDVITAKVDQKIDWNTEFLLPVQLPIMSGKVVMKLYDKDKIKDEIVGSIMFNLKEIMSDKQNGKFFWRNVYGAPLDMHGEVTDTMNANPDIASTWKGRILVQVEARKTEKPTCIRRLIDDETLKKAEPYLKYKEYEIIAEVSQGIALPSDDKYRVMIKIADFELTTEKPLVSNKNYNRWGHRFNQSTYKAPYIDIENMEKVFVYLMQSGKPICYWKGNISDFKEPNAQFKWIELLNDLSIGKIQDANKAGLICFKLSINDRTLNGPISFDQQPAWKKPPPKRLKTFKSRLYIFQCRDLPSADDDGQSDPYIKVWDQFGNAKTQVIMDNNNPIFFETLELPVVEAESENDLPPFIIDIYDKDAISINDDFIGRSVIFINPRTEYSRDGTIPDPKWYPVRVKQGSPPQGEILVSFCFVLNDYTFEFLPKNTKLSAKVDTKEFQVDINILGLRNLQSVGILPVKKAFLMFNLKSLLPPDDGRALENIRTQPGPPGPNPTINSMLSFRLPLPTMPLFCPKLVCNVYDYIFMGMNQPIIGTFTIPIGDLIQAIKKEREEETNAIQYILDELENIMKGQGIPTYSSQPPISSQFNLQTFGEQTVEESLKSKPSLLGRQGPQNNLYDQVKKNVQVEEEMKQPLLLIIEENEKPDHKNNMNNSFEKFQNPRRSNEIFNNSFEQQAQSPRSLLRGPTRVSGSANPSGNPSGNVSINVDRKKTTTNAMEIVKIDKFNSGKKAELLDQAIQEKEKWERQMQDARQRDAEEYKRQGGNIFKNVIMPQYKFDEVLKVHREVNIPPENLFIGLGWDEHPEHKRKHYRRFYPKELETVKEVMPVESPFTSYNIMRGQSRGAKKSWWKIFGMQDKQDESGEISSECIVGKFKGIVTVQTNEDQQIYQDTKARLVGELKVKLNQLSLQKVNKPIDMRLDKLATSEGRAKFDLDLETLGVSHLEVTKHLADLYSDELLGKLLLSQSKCIIRVYIISAFNLSSRDNGSESDPYLVVSCNGKEFNERDKYQENNPEPKFHERFEFDGTFPGCSPLVIKIRDYDDIFGDEDIGTTVIDLEDRFFSPEWQSIKQKPIEYRQLYHPSSSISQGTVLLWVNIIPKDIPLTEVPIYDIKPKPKEVFEVRVCVFDTKDVVCGDIEETSDVYARLFFDSNNAKETDTHFRCKNGKASFNYRLLFDIDDQRSNYDLTIQLYDRDFFKQNDILGDAVLNLKKPLEDAALTKRPLGMNKKYYSDYMMPPKREEQLAYKDENTFWVPVKSPNKDTGVLEVNGHVRLQVDIYPKDQADANKVGEARQEPNHSPFLPQPVGRLSFSLNPFKMLGELVGPGVLRKIYCYGCLICCCALIIMMLPFVASGVISQLIVHFIGL